MVIDPGGDVIASSHGHRPNGRPDRANRSDAWASGPCWRRRRAAGRVAAAPVVAMQIPIEGPDPRDEFLLNGIAEQAAAYGFDAGNVKPDRWLAEGDVLMLGPHRFDVLHCPGHTPGRVVFVNQAARFALVGRCAVPGVGRAH